METVSYVVAGEYGRILTAYLERFPRDQLHVELTADLARQPADVVRRVCEFIGVEPHSPARVGERFYASGRPRLSADAEADLKKYLARNVWPRVRYARQHRHAFDIWLRLWNVEPEAAGEPIDPDTAARLGEHYAEDARMLGPVAGIEVPWANP